MKFVLDTNIIFSGIYDLDSNAGKILFLATEEKLELFSPQQVKDELSIILGKKLKFLKNETEEMISSLPIQWIEKEIFEENLEMADKFIRHKKDVPILACALSLGVDIITGDKHFRDVKTKGIKIWKLKEALDDLNK